MWSRPAPTWADHHGAPSRSTRCRRKACRARYHAGRPAPCVHGRRPVPGSQRWSGDGPGGRPGCDQSQPAAAGARYAKSHAGNFTQGRPALLYARSFESAGRRPTSGFVTVTDTLPSGLSLVSMAAPLELHRQQLQTQRPASGGRIYPPITVTVNVAPQATSPEVNQAMVTGGGSASASTATRLPSFPSRRCSYCETHNGSFGLEDQCAYTITVSNQSGAGPRSERLPSPIRCLRTDPGIHDGRGMDCNRNSCTRSDALIGAQAIADYCNGQRGPNASSPQVNLASVREEEMPVPWESRIPLRSLRCRLERGEGHAGNFTQGQNGRLTPWCPTRPARARTMARCGDRDRAVGLTLVSMSGSGWACGCGRYLLA